MISIARNQVKSEKIKKSFIKEGLPNPKLDECNNNVENDINESDDEIDRG